jgi:hypothetical protein
MGRRMGVCYASETITARYVRFLGKKISLLHLPNNPLALIYKGFFLVFPPFCLSFLFFFFCEGDAVAKRMELEEEEKLIEATPDLVPSNSKRYCNIHFSFIHLNNYS